MGELVREAEAEGRTRSGLSDDMIRHVLSFLPLKDVVVAGTAFSRRLSCIEADILDLDVLDFSGISLETRSKLHSFHRFMDWLIGRYRKRLTRFSLSLNSSQACPLEPEKIRSWIHFAVEREVQHLSVDLFPRVDIWLPRSVANLPRLQSLQFPGCHFPSEPFHWPHLKELSFGEIMMVSYFLCDVFSGSPALELLKLQGCSGVCLIATDDSSLRELVIDSSRCDRVHIDSPNLLILRLRGCWQNFDSQSFNGTVPSLVEAELNFSQNGARGLDTDPPYHLLGAILDMVEHVPTLHIGRRCLKALAWLCNVDVYMEDFTKCKHLIIGSMSDRIYTCEITSLLERFPHLDELEIRGLWIDYEYEITPGKTRLDGHQRMLCDLCYGLPSGVQLASLDKYLPRVKTLVLRLSSAATGRVTTRTFDLVNGGEEMARLVARHISELSKRSSQPC